MYLKRVEVENFNKVEIRVPDGKCIGQDSGAEYLMANGLGKTAGIPVELN